MMNKFYYTVLFYFICHYASAQLNEGIIEYEKKIVTQKIINSNDEEKILNTPITLKTKSVLKFNNTAYSYKPLQDYNEDSMLQSAWVKKMILEKMGEYDQYYFEQSKKNGYKVAGLFYNLYTISNFFMPYDYVVTKETKNILGYHCKKAICTHKTTTGTSKIIVWFAPALPQHMGPEFYRGLKGTILEVNIDNSVVINATSIKAVKNLRIVKPNYGTKTTYEKYLKEIKQKK